MKVHKFDGSIERRVLTAMIVSDQVLSRLADKWEKKGMFESEWSNIIGKWCSDYYTEYGKAPMKNITTIYKRWARTAPKDSRELVDKYLASLSNEYKILSKDVNPDYVCDIAGELFERVKIKRLIDDLQAEVETGTVKKARGLIDKYDAVEIGSGRFIDLFSDKTAIKDAFKFKQTSIVKYTKGLKAFFGDALERDGFIAFMGSEKRGKTWWLLDMAWRGAMQGLNVAFFEVGDLSERQILKRFGVRAAGRPGRPDTIRYPILLEHGEPVCEVQFEERKFKQGLSYQEAVRAFQRLHKKVLEKTGKKDNFRLSVHPNDSISAAGVESILNSWKRKGWVADMVVVDYADILAPMNGAAESRDQINATWKRLRRISQTSHCLLVTATQASAASYKSDRLDRSMFSEDKRKYAHCTGMVSINQTDDEKKVGIQRLGWLVLRENHFEESKDVYVAGCLGIANPAVLSQF